MKKIIILKNNGGRLANQLWLFAGVYAYCLEKKYLIQNDSFLNYHKYFRFEPSNIFTKILSKIKNRKLSSRAYNLYANTISLFVKNNILNDNNNDYQLPPESSVDPAENKKVLYLSGWLFRNPTGLKKHHTKIKELFRPKEEYCKPGEDLINNLRKTYKNVVGVHIRQGDYKTWNDGKYYFSNHEVANILKDYLDKTNGHNKTFFVICSDGSIDPNQFQDINYVLGPGTEITDLHTLSLTNFIIGSNSTYNHWAAYYGSVPRKDFSHDQIDWTV